MEFNEQEYNQNSIISASNSQVKLAHTTLKIPCFISSNYCCEVEISKLNDISKTSLFPLSNHDDIDLLIIGTGEKPLFLSSKQQIAIKQMGIGVESMNSESASRSFNLLLSDARSVGVLLL